MISPPNLHYRTAFFLWEDLMSYFQVTLLTSLSTCLFSIFSISRLGPTFLSILRQTSLTWVHENNVLCQILLTTSSQMEVDQPWAVPSISQRDLCSPSCTALDPSNLRVAPLLPFCQPSIHPHPRDQPIWVPAYLWSSLHAGRKSRIVAHQDLAVKRQFEKRFLYWDRRDAPFWECIWSIVMSQNRI